MAHQPTITLMLCLNDVPPDASAGMIGVVGARHAVPLRLPRQQQHNSARLEPVMDFSVLLVYHDAMTRKAYPSDVSDEEWAFVAPYLTLMDEAAPQRNYSLRDVYNGLRYLLRTGAPWRMLPNTYRRGTWCINRPSAG